MQPLWQQPALEGYMNLKQMNWCNPIKNLWARQFKRTDLRFKKEVKHFRVLIEQLIPFRSSSCLSQVLCIIITTKAPQVWQNLLQNCKLTKSDTHSCRARLHKRRKIQKSSQQSPAYKHVSGGQRSSTIGLSVLTCQQRTTRCHTALRKTVVYGAWYTTPPHRTGPKR